MVFHANNSSNFAGVRTAFTGKKQIVVEANNGKRVLLDICDPRASDLSISEALQEGIHAPNPLAGVLTALHARNIAVDFAS